MSLPPGGWPRLREVFAGARALPADVRAAYLDEACGGDDALRQEAESLLAWDARAKRFLESPALLSNNAGVTKSLEGQRIGAYRLAARIGDRRDGRGLPGARHDPQSPGRDQGPAASRRQRP